MRYFTSHLSDFIILNMSSARDIQTGFSRCRWIHAAFSAPVLGDRQQE